MKVKQSVKRMISVFLCVVLTLQNVLTGSALGAASNIAEEQYGEAHNIKNGTPPEAFDNLTIAFMEKLPKGTNGARFGFKLVGILSDKYLAEKYDDFLADGGMDPDDWKTAGKPSGTYNEYLDQRTDSELPEIGFSVKVSFSEGMLEELPPEFDMALSDGTVVGTCELDVSGNMLTITGTVKKWVFGSFGVTFSGEASGEMEYTYDENTTVTVTPGSGSEDFIVLIPDDNIKQPEDSLYEINKEIVTSGDDIPEDELSIVYDIHANIKTTKAVMTADSASVSSAKPLSRKEKRLLKEKKKKAAQEARRLQKEKEEHKDDYENEFDRVFDPDNDWDWLDEEDAVSNGPGILSDLIDLLTPDQYVFEDEIQEEDYEEDTEEGLEEEEFEEATSSNISVKKSSDKKNTYRKASDTSISDESESNSKATDGNMKDNVATGSDIPEKAATAGNAPLNAVSNSSATYSNLRSADTLSGKTIVDKIPAGLEVVRVQRKINGSGDFEDISAIEDASKLDTLDGSNYALAADGTLTYKIADSGSPIIATADLRIFTKVPDEKYNDYMLKEDAVKWRFSNKVTLRGADEELLAVSKPVVKEYDLPAPFAKDGKVIDGTGGEIAWTLNATSYFSNANTKLWVVDQISDVENTHDYMTADVITVNGQQKEIQIVSDIQTETYSHMDTVTSIETWLTNNGISTDTTKVIVYQYKNSATNKTDSIMLIPLSENKNTDIEIKYKTKVKASAIDFSSTDPLNLVNEAKIRWRWPGGSGPGPSGDYGSASIKKDAEAKFNLVKKTADENAYDVSKNTITWKFEVNQAGVEAHDVTIEDELLDSEQSLVTPLNAQNGKLKLKARDGKIVEIPYVAPNDIGTATANCYTVKIETGKQTLVVFFKHLGPAEYYEFDVVTFVKNKDAIGTGNGNLINITNKAKVTGKVGTNPIGFELEAACPVKNVLIQKEAIPVVETDSSAMYNYADNTVKWRVTINPNNWNIKTAKITDDLPDGTHFAALTGVKQDGVDLTEKGFIPNSGGGSGWTDEKAPEGTYSVKCKVDNGTEIKVDVSQNADGEPLTFTFLPTSGTDAVTISTPFTFEFTTYVEEEHRKKFTSTNKDTLENTAKLTGTVVLDNVEFPANAVAAAENTFNPEPLKKSGKYENGKSITTGGITCEVTAIDWVIYVNRAQVEMERGVVTDDIKDVMELIPETMEVWTVELDETGKKEMPGKSAKLFPAQGDSPIDPMQPKLPFTRLDDTGFVYTIPQDVNSKKTLKFKFTTALVDDATVDDMTNHVKLTGSPGEDHTNEVSAEGVKTFKLASYATANGLFFAKIFKTSGNKLGKFPLQGATFDIYKMTPKSGGDTTTVEGWEKDPSKAGQPLKTRKSNRAGNASFMFLEQDTLYKIVEKEAPAGYDTIKEEDFCWYVVPSLNSKNEKDFPSDPSSDPDAKYAVYVNTSEEHYKKFEVMNSPSQLPDAQALKIVKKGQNGQFLAGAEFKATYGSKLEYTAISGTDGVVKFDQLDKLSKGEYYTISETAVGYKPKSLSLKAEVYLDENGNMVANLKDDAGDLTEEGADPNKIKVLINDPIVQDGSFKKVDQNGTPIKGVKFEVERRGDGGQLLSAPSEIAADKVQICIDVDGDPRMKMAGADSVIHSAESWYPYRPISDEADEDKKVLTSDSNGIVSFTLPYGDYKITEVSQPSDFPLLPGEDFAVVYVRITGAGTFISETPIDKDNIKTWTGTKSPDEKGNLVQVENKLQYGILKIQKAVGERNTDNSQELAAVQKDSNNIPVPIPDISFKIYYNTGAADSPVKGAEVVTLKTNANGQLEAPTDGEYGTAGKSKWLTVGQYVLEEQSSDKYYGTGTVLKLIPFEIKQGTLEQGTSTFTPDVVTIGWNGLKSTVEHSPATQPLFLNEPKRGTMTLEKVDSADKTKKLSGAKFEVRVDAPDNGTNPDKDKYVADLVESPSGSGTYVLAAPSGSDSATTDSTGKTYLKTENGAISILYGNYYLRETKAPEGYDIPAASTVFKVKVNAADITEIELDNNQKGDITNKLPSQDLKIQKLLEKRRAKAGTNETEFDGYEKGVGFTFTLGTDNEHKGPMNGASFTPRISTTSDADNSDKAFAEFKDVPVGSYILTESAVPAEYGSVTESSNPPHVIIMNKVAVKVTKDGVTYSYADTSGGSIEATPGTENGAREKSVTVTNQGKSDALLVVRNNWQLGSAQGIKAGVGAKQSSETWPISGVQFVLKNKVTNAELTVTSASDGKITFAELPFGNYVLTEKNPSDGYQAMDPIEFTVNSATEVKIQSTGRTDGIIENLLMTKSIKFAKTDQNGKPLGSDRTANIVFSVTRDDGSIPASLPVGYTLPSNIKPDSAGYVLIENLPYGTYTITENPVTGDPILPDNAGISFKVKIEKDPDNTDADKPGTKVTITPVKPSGAAVSLRQPNAIESGKDNDLFDFTTGSNRFTLVNTLKHGDIRIHKKLGGLADGGGIEELKDSLPGIKFNIYQKTGSETVPSNPDQPYLTLTTDSKGHFVSQNGWYGDDVDNRKQLLTGSYFIKEIVPPGYKLMDPAHTYTEFTVEDSSDGNVTEFTHDGRGIPTASIIDAGSPYGSFYNIKESGHIEGLKYTMDGGSEIGLSGAEFELKPLDIPDYPTKTILSGANGKLSIRELPLGTYELSEIKAPAGYKKSDETFTIKLVTKDVTVTKDTQGNDIKFLNEPAAAITVEKKAQTIENNNINGAMKPGQGFLFKITGRSAGQSAAGEKLETFINASDITGADSVEIRKTGEQDDGVYVTTGSGGKIVIDNLPLGSYTVQEQENGKTDADGPYVPDLTKYPADIAIDHTTGSLSLPVIKVENNLRRGQIKGLKTSDDGTTPLKDAVIGLFPAGTVSFTEGNLWCNQKVLTGEDGVYLFKDIPYGTYLIAELTAPSGYSLNTATKYEVTVSSETEKTDGFLIEGNQPRAEAETKLVIKNTKAPSTGSSSGGGGSNRPPQSTGPGPGSETTESPLNPGETSPSNPGDLVPENPLPTLPVESAPDGGSVVIIPPDIPIGTDLEVKNPDGDTVYTGKTDESRQLHVDLPPGTYTLVMFDEEQVPLSSMTFVIEDPFTPLGSLAAPDAGDHSVPIVVLAVLMMVSLSGIILLSRRKRQEKNHSEDNK